MCWHEVRRTLQSRITMPFKPGKHRDRPQIQGFSLGNFLRIWSQSLFWGFPLVKKKQCWLCADRSSVAICCHAVWFVNPPPGCVACLKQVGQVGRVPAVNTLTCIYIYNYILYMVVNTNTHIIYIYREIIKVMNVLLLIPSSSSCSVIGKHHFAMCIVCVCVRLCMQSSGSLVLLRFRFVRPVSVKCEFFPASAF